MMFTGNKSSGTIFGSHEWHFEKLEILLAASDSTFKDLKSSYRKIGITFHKI